VIALGPGFEAGRDCHLVIETNRGHHLGRIIPSGAAEPNTGIPGPIGGATAERLLRAPVAGQFTSACRIGEMVRKGDVMGEVDGSPVAAGLDGVLRGLIRSPTEVSQGLKLGDIDPRGDAGYCGTISDKARAIAGSALECVLRHCNRPPDAG
jgi:xanthine dehydrogenase accessory factor